MKITLTAVAAPMGWAIVACADGENYIVETGLKTTARLEYWKRNLALIEQSIEKIVKRSVD